MPALPACRQAGPSGMTWENKMETQLKKLIEDILSEYCKEKGITLPAQFKVELQLTKDPAHGDFATNAAFRLAKELKKNPQVIAGDVANLLNQAKSKTSIIDRVEVAGGGFINIYVTKTSFTQILRDILEKDRAYGCSDFGKGRKVLVEFVSANPTGPLTIAHGRQAAVGDALARILKATGHQVTSEYYLNDAGRQMNLLGKSLRARYLTELGIPTPLPEDGYQGDYLIETAKKLIKLQGKDLAKEEESKLADICRQFAGDDIMEGIRKDLADLQVTFDSYFNERTLYEQGTVEQVLGLLKQKDYLYEQDGALWFRSTAFKDDKDRVVKKSSGEYTYLAPDIAYHHQKFQRGFNWLVNLLGPDHHGYIARLKAACEALGHPAQNVDVLIVQLTTLFRKGVPVRMSTRAGEFVTLRELIDEVGVDATRFFFVMRKIESPLDFDLELAKQKSQDNPVFYLQYAYARISSLIRFANQGISRAANLELLAAQEEKDLIKVVSEFPKALVQASQMLEPYRLGDYLRELATSFHKFYTYHRIVNEDAELTRARLLLTETVRITLRNGLELLGISQPESM